MRITIHFDSAWEHELREIAKAHRKAEFCHDLEFQPGDGPKVVVGGAAWNGKCAAMEPKEALCFLAEVVAATSVSGSCANSLLSVLDSRD